MFTISNGLAEDLFTEHHKKHDNTVSKKENYKSIGLKQNYRFLIQLLKNSKIAVMKKLNELQENTEDSSMSSGIESINRRNIFPKRMKL